MCGLTIPLSNDTLTTIATDLSFSYTVTRLLQVQVEALTGALAEYKAENSKAAEMKLRYKSIIAGLETELRDSQSERASLVSMCNELMARLEMQSRAKA